MNSIYSPYKNNIKTNNYYPNRVKQILEKQKIKKKKKYKKMFQMNGKYNYFPNSNNDFSKRVFSENCLNLLIHIKKKNKN